MRHVRRRRSRWRSAASQPACSDSRKQEGAQIAVQAVKAWLDSRAADEPGADMHVIFDVYTEQDENFYRAILGKDEEPANDAEE